MENQQRQFRVCPACSALTPASNPTCIECGEQSIQAAIEAEEARREAIFARAYFMRRTPFTYAFLIVNLLVFLLMSFAGGSDNPNVLQAFGAKLNYLLRNGEWWRLITPIFIHIGIIHLAFNSYALYALGPQVEKLFGSAKFVVLYLGAGIAGVLGSYLFTPGDVPSAGASGALFGLIGVLTVFGFKYKRELPGVFRTAFGARMLPIILFNLMFGLTVPGIDNAAHIGGLIAGGAMTLIVPYAPPGKLKPGLAWRLAQFACLMLILISFAAVARRYDGPRLSSKNLGPPSLPLWSESPASRYLNSMEGGRRTYTDARNGFVSEIKKSPEESDPANLARAIAKVDRAIEVLSNAPSLGDSSVRLRDSLIAILGELRETIKEYQDSKNINLVALKAADREFERFNEDYFRWVKTEGRKYGIRIENPRESA